MSKFRIAATALCAVAGLGLMVYAALLAAPLVAVPAFLAGVGKGAIMVPGLVLFGGAMFSLALR
ncbi:MAG: hypothetical protein GC131_00955 [Alphaproteobacteria bacterium]|nr:hypothetical protein [Alphaproteobacteria bacterium]